eukprot:TRINITY_DN28381_c0_g1_i1.p1 TRINITY_DN28381_c0_g1~~TRINITY_DN28381_c0_g1_i1.p1  ORF type:complete len:188 (-),score=34.80 TRINITY_DN28381_c0_g1_i1:68-631(-)
MGTISGKRVHGASMSFASPISWCKQSAERNAEAFEEDPSITPARLFKASRLAAAYCRNVPGAPRSRTRKTAPTTTSAGELEAPVEPLTYIQSRTLSPDAPAWFYPNMSFRGGMDTVISHAASAAQSRGRGLSAMAGASAAAAKGQTVAEKASAQGLWWTAAGEPLKGRSPLPYGGFPEDVNSRVGHP